MELLSSNPNFCSNCGEKLEVNGGTDECPKCHSALHAHAKNKLSSPAVTGQLPYKSPGTTALIAFLGGLFGLPGIGHMYVGKVINGIGVLIGALVFFCIYVHLVGNPRRTCFRDNRDHWYWIHSPFYMANI